MLPAEDLKPRQLEVAREIAEAKSLIYGAVDDEALLRERLELVFKLLEVAGDLWRKASDEAKRWLLNAVFEEVAIDLEDDENGGPARTGKCETSCRSAARLSDLS